MKKLSPQEELAALASKLKTIESTGISEAGVVNTVRTGYNAMKGLTGGLVSGGKTLKNIKNAARAKEDEILDKAIKQSQIVRANAATQTAAAKAGAKARVPLAVTGAAAGGAYGMNAINSPQSAPSQADIHSLAAQLEPYKSDPQIAALLNVYYQKFPK